MHLNPWQNFGFLNMEKIDLKEIEAESSNHWFAFLNMHNNQIGTINSNAFKTLFNLRVLSLKGNKLWRLTEKLFQSQSKLEELFVNGNKIPNVDIVSVKNRVAK